MLKDNNIIAKTDELILFIYSVYRKIFFKYAFCDNNCSIEYSLKELQHENKNIYSILCIPKNENELKIIKSNWEIDGIIEKSKK